MVLVLVPQAEVAALASALPVLPLIRGEALAVAFVQVQVLALASALASALPPAPELLAWAPPKAGQPALRYRRPTSSINPPRSLRSRFFGVGLDLAAYRWHHSA